MRDEPPAMAQTVQVAFLLPERSNSPPYFENDVWVFVWVLWIDFNFLLFSGLLNAITCVKSSRLFDFCFTSKLIFNANIKVNYDLIFNDW